MTREGSADLLRHYVEQVWHAKNPDALDKFLSPDYRRHVGFHNPPLTLDEQKVLVGSFQTAFPDAELSVEDVVVEAGMLAFRSVFRGTHRGTFRGIRPTGRRITVRLLDLMRIENGRIVEQWGGPDLLDLLTQLGATVSSDQDAQI